MVFEPVKAKNLTAKKGKLFHKRMISLFGHIFTFRAKNQKCLLSFREPLRNMGNKKNKLSHVNAYKMFVLYSCQEPLLLSGYCNKTAMFLYVLCASTLVQVRKLK